MECEMKRRGGQMGGMQGETVTVNRLMRQIKKEEGEGKDSVSG